MKNRLPILSLLSILLITGFPAVAQDRSSGIQISFFGDEIRVPVASADMQVSLQRPISKETLHAMYRQLENSDYALLVERLTAYKQKEGLNDWLYYQLVRRTAQYLSPKLVDYERYTMYKWFLMNKSGYQVKLAFSDQKLLMYVQSDDNIYDIPLFMHEGKQFVCLNIHDFDKPDLVAHPLTLVDLSVPGPERPFSYRINRIPDFKTNHLSEKQVAFYYHEEENRYNIRLDPEFNSLFNNYPSVDFESYFNIPMSRHTYSSLIPVLKKQLKKKDMKAGVDYLMQFTRYAFPYEDDQAQFGKEKRLSPEQTLFYAYSDCDDRVALFFFLVKEIYNLPMIALKYPDHITIAVAFDSPVGTPVDYNGKKYSVCEPTPQGEELGLGQIPVRFKNMRYEVVYAYNPAN